MNGVWDGQGFRKAEPLVFKNMIVAFYGAQVPSGWALCDGANGTPDLRGRLVVGDSAAGAGTAGGTDDLFDGLTHAGFALTSHSNHAPTQPSAHAAHSPTQPATHSAHVVTQPGSHGTHASGGSHAHNSHTEDFLGSAAVVGSKLLYAAASHAPDGGHTHDAHSAHVNWDVTAHSGHVSFAVDAHSAHAGFAVDAHSAHSITQPDAHVPTGWQLAYIMKV